MLALKMLYIAIQGPMRYVSEVDKRDISEFMNGRKNGIKADLRMHEGNENEMQ